MRPPVALLFVSLLASCGSRSGSFTSDEAGSASGGSSGGAATGGVESAGAGAPEGAVHRYDKASGQLETIATAQHVPRAVAADADCVYWTNSGFQSAGGSVMRGPR